jgi:beta-glucanase (GH16 family)
VIAVSAQSSTSCSATSQCPEETPCCSEFGFCGSDYFCLGGCNPLGSHALDSCQPMPICQNANHTFADDSRILGNATEFDGNATKYDWVLDKGNIVNTNQSGGELEMILTESNGGTRLSSTRYVHYGTITARVKTSHWAGVVTAFITMSSIKDEIDWEWPGDQTTEAQTNYFWQGVIPQTTGGATENGLTDTSQNYHEYTIDWQKDALNFLIDGKTVRTLKASDTMNGSVSQYPNTPSRIQLSLWPAGISSEAPGTVQWAGGMINWQDPDYVSAGHFSATISSVSVQCADSGSTGNMTAYVYGSNSSTSTPNITMSTASTLLGGASDSSSSSSGISSKIGEYAGIGAGGLLALIIAALIVRKCMQSKRKAAPTTALGGFATGTQPYAPLNENHSMTNVGYNPPQYGQQPYTPQYNPQQGYRR